MFDKNSTLGKLNIEKNGVVCQAKRPQDMKEGFKAILQVKRC
jgi:hypothetical protein